MLSTVQPLKFRGTAENYPGRLEGQRVQLDSEITNQRDFETLYPGMKFDDTFTIVTDSGKFPIAKGSEITQVRLVTFQAPDGKQGMSAASRFNVIP
ncbi:MAG: hypothetical protein IPK79_09965 [Vampirovibrionales bacterium]|nr:hypothetical protein [Vampirovibrionales bacterium]